MLTTLDMKMSHSLSPGVFGAMYFALVYYAIGHSDAVNSFGCSQLHMYNVRKSVVPL